MNPILFACVASFSTESALTLGIVRTLPSSALLGACCCIRQGVEDPASLVSFHTRYTELNLPRMGVSAPDQADGASLSSLVASSALADEQSFNAQQDGHALHLLAAEVTSSWFRTFGAEPIFGPTFRPEDDQKGASHTVVLSYGAWQRLFGGQHDAIGRSLVLDGQPYRVIGVMHSDFDWPRSPRRLGVPRPRAYGYAAGELSVSPPSQAQRPCCCSPRWWPRSPRTPRSATPALGRATQ